MWKVNKPESPFKFSDISSHSLSHQIEQAVENKETIATRISIEILGSTILYKVGKYYLLLTSSVSTFNGNILPKRD